ncbi:unnamed protein product [Ambrosiozyma monospora]|uniref:Unnamed protein product n=1 Tax=Ambrosiozyma monospora TaxID=43982 RepID=A0ACB5U5H6_AMBMO|nr:unnamed protein product [Ambrosiozyma monospora]
MHLRVIKDSAVRNRTKKTIKFDIGIGDTLHDDGVVFPDAFDNNPDQAEQTNPLRTDQEQQSYETVQETSSSEQQGQENVEQEMLEDSDDETESPVITPDYIRDEVTGRYTENLSREWFVITPNDPDLQNLNEAIKVPDGVTFPSDFFESIKERITGLETELYKKAILKDLIHGSYSYILFDSQVRAIRHDFEKYCKDIDFDFPFARKTIPFSLGT